MKLADAAALFVHAIALGTLFALVAFIGARSAAGSDRTKLAEALQGASNGLFLCVGLTGTMIVVANSIVRAFAVAAAIALVRFRIKLDQKTSSAAVLFPILGGIACGLDELALAWTLLGVYVALGAIVVIAARAFALPVAPPSAVAAPRVRSLTHVRRRACTFVGRDSRARS